MSEPTPKEQLQREDLLSFAVLEERLQAAQLRIEIAKLQIQNKYKLGDSDRAFRTP